MINKNKVFIIAEAGNNHEGNFTIAKKLVDEAYKSGADAIKFQTYNVDKFISPGNKETYNKFKKYSLSRDQFNKLARYCKKKKIIFFSTPFDLESAYFLNNIQNIFKISSGDNNFYDLIRTVVKFNKELIISTGFLNIKNIKEIYKYLISIKDKKKLKLHFLHCISCYPTELDKINLLSIRKIEKEFPTIGVGFSDHTIGMKAAVYAVLLGAKIIEKHFTLDNNFSNHRDHKISLNPKDFKEMVLRIREAEMIMGKEIKIINNSEKLNMVNARRSAYAKNDLTIGKVLKKNDVIFLRPGNGVSHKKILSLYGKKIKKNILKNTQLKKRYFI